MSSLPHLTLRGTLLSLVIGISACIREIDEEITPTPMLPPRVSIDEAIKPVYPTLDIELVKPPAPPIETPTVDRVINQRVGGLKYKGKPTARDLLYDVSIRKWSGVYTPEYPWCWNKAQIRAESAFRYDAVSPVGAKGLGQFMPATWVQMVRELKLDKDADAFNPALNIQATTYYMAKLRANFKKPRPEWDRHSLAMASYNAGLGNILKAQAYTGSLMYTPMITHLPKVTGHHHVETKNYVERIWGYVAEYEREGLCD